MDIIWFAAVALATYRLTRFVTADVIMEPVRVAALKRSQFLGYLVSCDWCLSIWVAPPMMAVAMNWQDAPVARWAVGFLALSALVGMASIVEARLDRQ